MQKAIIAVFDEEAFARSAQGELIGSGIAADRVHIRSAQSLRAQSGEAGPSDTEYPGEHEGFMQRIRHFFDVVFNDEDEERRRYGELYMEAVRRGSCVLTVVADDDGRIDAIEDILERHGAVDIDERRAHWQSRGWQGFDENAPALADAELAQERAYYRNPMASPAAIGSGSSLGGTVTADALSEDDEDERIDDAQLEDRLADDQIAAQNHGLPPIARGSEAQGRRARIFTGWR